MANVAVRILLTARDAAGAVVGRVTRKIRGLRFEMGKVNLLMGGLAAGGIARLTKGLFNLGTSVEETQSKFVATFGESSQTVQDFLDTFGKLAGLSRVQGQELSASAGAIVQGMGLTKEAAAEASIQIVRLGADIASFNNVAGGAENAVLRVTSALGGEFEALKRVGIVLRAAEVDRRALINTGKSSTAELTERERVLARLQLIQQKAVVQTGDLERTLESMANTGRRLSGVFRTQRETMGTIFLESFRLTGGFEDMASTVDGLGGFLDENRNKMAAWGAVIISTVKVVVSAFATGLRIIWNALQTVTETAGSLIGIAISMVKGDFGGMVEGFREIKESAVGNFNDVTESIGNTQAQIEGFMDAVQRAIRESQGIDTGIAEAVGRGKVFGADAPKRVETAEEARIRKLEELNDALTETIKASERLEALFKLGVVSEEEFTSQTAVLTAQLQGFIEDGRLTEDQIIRVDRAVVDVGGIGKRLIIDVPFKAGVAQLGLAKALFDSNVLSSREFVEKVRALAPAMLAFKESGELTEQQQLRMARVLGDLIAKADELGIDRGELLPGLAEDLSFLEKIGLELRSIFTETQSIGRIFAEIGIGFLEGFGDAVEAAFAAFADGSITASQAFKKSMLGAIASVARAQGQLFLAKAAGALGEGFLGNPAGFAAAAKFTAAASLMFALAGRIGGGLAASGKGPGAGTPFQQRDRLEGSRGEATIIIKGGLLDMSDPRQAAALANAINQLESRRVIIKGGS